MCTNLNVCLELGARGDGGSLAEGRATGRGPGAKLGEARHTARVQRRVAHIRPPVLPASSAPHHDLSLEVLCGGIPLCPVDLLAHLRVGNEALVDARVAVRLGPDRWVVAHV